MQSRDFGKRGARNKKGKSVAEFLRDKGVFSNTDIKTAKEALEQIISIQAGDISSYLGESFEEAKPILDFALGISGSAIGTKTQGLLMGGSAGPGSIIAAGKGAEAMRNIFLKMPQSQKLLFTAELLQNPTLLATMLREYGDRGQAKTIVESITNHLRENFYVTTPKRFTTAILPDEGFEKQEEDVGPTLPPVVDDASPAIPPVSDASPAFNAVRPAPLTVAQASPAQSDPQTRQKYAALFPDDPTSAMIRGSQGGIGSLFG